MLKLYTKTGDKGLSNTITSGRIPKDHPLFEALGTLDELNATLGLTTHSLTQPSTNLPTSFLTTTYQELQSIQHLLLTIGANLAGSTKVKLTKTDLTFLENRIDYYQTHT